MASGLLRAISVAFPPPHYLSMPVFGVDLSYHSVRAVALESHNGTMGRTLTLKKWSEHHITKGGVVYEEDLSKQAELRDILTSLRKDLGVKYAAASLPDDKAFIFKIPVPAGSDAQIRGAITFQLEDNVSMPASEAVFDYELLRGKGGQLEAVVVVFPRKVVEGAAALFKKAGIMPVSFAMTADALAAAVVPAGDTTVRLLVNIGQHNTGICVVDRGVVCFTTTLNFGEDSLSSAISKQFNVAPDVAARAINGDLSGLPGHQSPLMLLQSVVGTLSALRDESLRIVEYWRTHETGGDSSREISEVVLCGNGANTPGIDEYLTADMKMPVVVGNPWQNAGDLTHALPALSFSDSLSYSCAIGLSVKVADREI